MASASWSTATASRAAAARLFDTLLIAAICHWLDRQADGAAPSWLRALRDPALARVLAALHERPAEPWTVESLAREVHVSRATLARRFAGAVGEPPLRYLARWRMYLAAQRLKYSTDTVEAIAREVGYASEYASTARSRGTAASPPAATGGSRAPRDAKRRGVRGGLHASERDRRPDLPGDGPEVGQAR